MESCQWNLWSSKVCIKERNSTLPSLLYMVVETDPKKCLENEVLASSSVVGSSISVSLVVHSDDIVFFLQHFLYSLYLPNGHLEKNVWHVEQ